MYRILLYDAATFDLVKIVTNNANETGATCESEIEIKCRKRQRQRQVEDEDEEEEEIVNESYGTVDEEDGCVGDLKQMYRRPLAQKRTEINNTQAEGPICVNSVAFHPYCALLISITGT